SSLSSKVPGIAGQLTLTKGPFPHRERRWMSLARISLPVPLCPWSRTGIFAFAAFSTLFRIAPMAGELPKITSSGGSSAVGANTAGSEVTTHPMIMFQKADLATTFEYQQSHRRTWSPSPDQKQHAISNDHLLLLVRTAEALSFASRGLGSLRPFWSCATQRLRRPPQIQPVVRQAQAGPRGARALSHSS